MFKEPYINDDDLLAERISKLNSSEVISTPRAEEIIDNNSKILDLHDLIKIRTNIVQYSDDKKLSDMWNKDIYLDKAIIYNPIGNEILIANVSDIYDKVKFYFSSYDEMVLVLGNSKKNGHEIYKNLDPRKNTNSTKLYTDDLKEESNETFKKEAIDEILNSLFNEGSKEFRNKLFTYGQSVDIDLEYSIIEGYYEVKFFKLNKDLDDNGKYKISVSCSPEYNFMGRHEYLCE